MSSPAGKKRRKSKGSSPPARLFPSREEIPRLFAVVAIASSVVAACNYAVVVLNRQPKPFCDTDELSPFPLSDLCEPCPDNGLCSSGQLECLHGYKKQGRRCLEDGEINQTAKKLSDQLEHHVCDAYARALCDNDGKIWFQEEDIAKILNEYKSWGSTGLRDDTFIFVKQKVLGTIQSSLEKRAIIDGSKEYKCPDMLAERLKPLKCRVRQWVYRHAFHVTTVSAVFLGLIRFLWSMHQKRKLSNRAEQLYEQVCEILVDNATEAKSMNNKGDTWVVASWVRDHLLLPIERKDAVLWKKVEELVLEDSRIDQYPKLVKGESKIVWEWQVDGSLSSKMKANKAASKKKHNIFSSHQRSESKVQALNS